MHYRSLLAVPVLACSVFGVAADFGPEAWNRRNDQGTGALVLSHKMEINDQCIEQRYVWRIVGERGRSLLSEFEFDGDAYNIAGRTVLPSGETIPIKAGKDTLVKKVGSDESREALKIVPPGMTSDCIVEIRYRVPTRFDVLRQYQVRVDANFGFYYRGYIGMPCPVELAEISVSKLLLANWNLNAFDQKPLVKETGTVRQFIFSGLPAYGAPPFSRRATRMLPSIDIFMNPKELDKASRKEPAQFWKGTANAWAIPSFIENVSLGKHYKALSESLREGLEGTDVQKASVLMMRLGERIRNLDSLTDEEKQKDYGEKKDDPFNNRDLNGIANRGNSHSLGIFLTYLQVLKDAGIPFKLALGADGEIFMFNPEHLNATILSSCMAVVEGPDKAPFYFDPSSRFMTPGVVPSSLQGMQGFLVDPKTRSGVFFTWPVQPATLNRSAYTYELGLQDDGLNVKLEASFGGYFDQAARRHFIGKDPVEQKKVLKEGIDGSQRSVDVKRVDVINAQSVRKDLTLKVEASQELEAGRRRTFNPFPLMNSPITMPSSWPETRTDFIFAPCAFTWLATSQFQVPKGSSLQAVDPLEQENAFGRVIWRTETQGDQVKVILRVDLNEPIATPQYYPLFREFMGWVNEAYQRSLTLEKAGS